MADDGGKPIRNFGITREVELLADATTVSGSNTIPAGSVVTIEEQYGGSTLVSWNLGLFEIPDDVSVKQYMEPPESLIPAT